ncbi:MAG: hypothetical protein AAF525_03035, partial [Pseudomonadota bacterium]
FLYTLPIFIPMIFLGRDLVAVMYNEKYQEAGTYLVLIAMTSAISAPRSQAIWVCLATADGFGHTLTRTVATIARIAGVFFGYHLYGVVGMIVADVAAQLVLYPFEAWRLQRQRLWFPLLDLTILIVYLSAGALSYFYGPFLFDSPVFLK